MRLASLVEEYLVDAHLRHEGLGRDGDGVGNFVHADLHRRKASRQQFAPRIGILRPDGQRAGGDVDLRFGGVNRGFETLLPSLDGEREARAGLDLVGIAFGNEKVDLQGRNLRELGHHDAGRGVGAFADVAQADHAVERRPQLRERDVRLHDVDVSVEHRQFRAGLFVGLLAHGVFFE